MDILNSYMPASRGGYSSANFSLRTNNVGKDPKQVGGDFESFVFYRPMLSMMREEQFETKEDPFFNSDEMRNIQEMHDEVIADYLGAQGNLGMIKLLEETTHISDKRVSHGAT